jgi:hypothetical protein
MAPVEFKHKSILLPVEKRKRATGSQNNYEQIIQNLTDLFNSTDDNNDNWYSAFNSVRKHVMAEYDFTEAQLKKHLVYHMMDNMLTADKLILLANTVFSSEVEKLIKMYFDENIVTAENGDIGISFTTDNKKTRIFHPSDNGWVEAPFVETANILRSKDYKRKYVFHKQSLN